jgi:hypothetical protein
MLRILMPGVSVAIPALAILFAIELFQLTGVAARMLTSDHVLVRIAAHLLGTYFGFLDLIAYVAGVAIVYLFDSQRRR